MCAGVVCDVFSSGEQVISRCWAHDKHLTTTPTALGTLDQQSEDSRMGPHIISLDHVGL
ncbi:hypothetical protein I79_019302 [Cricetulus griseus]|uniref:Uncharacterized protein n=1 Tax=Cricetulus griseus TaxID=10029 RepID=G3I721_CRIGR|nr:hypothetical protein I79_019302 [Cricetulus griseus]